MNFEWDAKKAAANLVKHGVSFEEAVTVFADFGGSTIFDPDHSAGEDRYITMGLSNHGRLIVVWHTDRAGATRLIGARKANRRETARYTDERP
ncbi:BrnT family toxin [Botrimarina sp.]|uniref:BrnT family toxin n=1 Tax=Botrimarina sp. TaxID=2795802 RepID=UPI0032ED2E1A